MRIPEPICRKIAEKHPLIAGKLRNESFVNLCMLYFSFGISFVFLVFCLYSGFTQRSLWFMVLGLYNLLFSLIRLSVAMVTRHKLFTPRSDETPTHFEARLSLLIGLWLLIVSLVFTAISVETIIRNQSLHYPPFFLILLVLFNIVRFVILGIGILQKRNIGSTLSHTVQRTNMIVCLCSIYTTQVALLDTFSHNEVFRLILNLFTCTIVFYGILSISIDTVHSARMALHPNLAEEDVQPV